ncbi:hypothetical protein [Cedecea colo]|nr:hypothetical protein [Cedecea colo]
MVPKSNPSSANALVTDGGTAAVNLDAEIRINIQVHRPLMQISAASLA